MVHNRRVYSECVIQSDSMLVVSKLVIPDDADLEPQENVVKEIFVKQLVGKTMYKFHIRQD